MSGQKKTTKNRPTAAARKAAAARAERNGGAKFCTWRGIKFELPEKLPATVGLDWAEIEASDEIAPLYRFIIGILGPEGMATFRQKVADDGDPVEELEQIFESLFDEIFGAYGVSLGESEASQSS